MANERLIMVDQLTNSFLNLRDRNDMSIQAQYELQLFWNGLRRLSMEDFEIKAVWVHPALHRMPHMERMVVLRNKADASLWSCQHTVIHKNSMLPGIELYPLFARCNRRRENDPNFPLLTPEMVQLVDSDTFWRVCFLDGTFYANSIARWKNIPEDPFDINIPNVFDHAIKPPYIHNSQRIR